MSNYLDELKQWERDTGYPTIYEHVPELFPEFRFVRHMEGGDKDHWASPLKLNLDNPRTATKEKTVLYRRDMCFREQGDFDNAISVIDRLMADYNLANMYEVNCYVAQRFGLKMPTPGGYSEVKTRKEKLLELLEDYFAWILQNGDNGNCVAARAYLERRGFSSEWVKKLRFGLVPAWSKVEEYVKSKGFTLDELDEACYVKGENGNSSVGFLHLLAIPYRSNGYLKGFLFRAIDRTVTPKYKANAGLDRKNSFFNIAQGYENKELIVVEGELDALTATANGFKDVVAIGGSEISGERRNQIFDAFNRGTSKITLCLDLDNDKDGNANYGKRYLSNMKSIMTILNIRPEFRELYVAEFKSTTDPDAFIHTEGAEAFAKILAKAKPWWEYVASEMKR